MLLKNLEKASPEFQRHHLRTELDLLGLVSQQMFLDTGLAQGIVWRGLRDSPLDIRVALIRRPAAWEVIASAPLLLSALDGSLTRYLQTPHGASVTGDTDHFLVVESLSPLIKLLTNIERMYPVRHDVPEAQVQQFVTELLGGTQSGHEEQAPLVLNEVRVTGWVEALLPTPEGYRLQVKLTQSGATVPVTFQSQDPERMPAVALGCFVYLAGELMENGVRAYDLQVFPPKG